MNVRTILNGVKADPLTPLLREIEERTPRANDVALYVESYQFYYLTLERLLNEMSLSRRFRNGPYYILKYGGKYTPQQKKLARQFNQSKRYFELDFVNFMIHSRILLDRTIALSRYFLSEKVLPSFVSFNDHKKFFQNPSHRPYGKHERYAQYISDETPWFDETLKKVRDKFVVHAQNHWKYFGLPGFGPTEVELFIFPRPSSREKSPTHPDHIRVSILGLVDNVQGFLKFFSTYGKQCIV
jgi:hypothetical protein